MVNPKKKRQIIHERTLDVSKTGDERTNDFNLIGEKIPPLSTIRTQLRNIESLLNRTITTPIRTEFDRLRIALNLEQYGELVGFKEWGLENVSNPTAPPSYKEDKELKAEQNEPRIFINPFIEEDTNEYDISDLPDIADYDDTFNPLVSEEAESVIESENEANEGDELDILHDRKVKRRIRYDDYKGVIGLNNMFICNGYFVVDLTGKWQADTGVLGSLHRDNIRDALEKVLEMHIVNFDVKEFLNYAQVFLCDVCVDISLDSKAQVLRYIDGISSFFPIATNRFSIGKYGRHGLTLKPLAKTSGYSFAIYSKGQELDYSIKRRTRATQYTEIIENVGTELAERTLRLEVKLFKMKNIRTALNVSSPEKGVVRLIDVLDSTAPVMLMMFELFSGNPNELRDRLDWLKTTVIAPEGLTLSEIFIAERFVELLKENNFSLVLTKSHIRTEYGDVSDTELESFNSLANSRRNILNFLVYRKPKSITIMLDVLAKLNAYYSTGMEGNND